jgi:hypothetical protein
MATMMTASGSGDPGEALELFQSVNFWLEIVGVILFFSFGTVVTLAVIYNYMLEYEDKKTNKIETGAVWERVKATMVMYFGTFILNILLFIVAIGALVLVISIFAAMAGFMAVLIGIAGFIAVYYIFVVFSLMFIVRGYERVAYFEAISRCFLLIRGKWWSTFGLIVVMSILQTIINYIITIPLAIPSFIATMHSIENNTFSDQSTSFATFSGIVQMVSFFTSFLLSCLTTIAIAFQYFNLVEMKEAKGLLSRIDNIGQQPEAPRDEHY